MVQIYPADLVILISTVQSVFLSVIILQKYRTSLANKTLSLLFFSYAMVMAEMILWDMEYQMVWPRFVLLFTGTPFLIGPLHFLYTAYLSHYSPNFKKIHLLHFIPFVLFEISMLPLVLKSNEDIIKSIAYSETGEISVVSLALNWAIMFHAITYTIFIVIVTKKYSARIQNIFSSLDNIRLGWLRNVSILFSTGIVLYMVENTLNTSGIISNKFMVSSLVTPCIIYVMGYLAILKSEIYANPEFNRQIEEVPAEESEEELVEETSPQRKYVKSGLSEDRANEIVNRLSEIMEKEKPYLNSELTLSKLAEMIPVQPHNLSEVINTRLNQSFFDFINKYRVEKVKADLLDPSKNSYTLLAIGMDAGFNSKSSFNTIFKKYAGVTPSEFKKNMGMIKG